MFISSAQLNILLPAVEPLPWPALPCFPDLCDMMTNPGLAGHPGSPATLRRLYTAYHITRRHLSSLPIKVLSPPSCMRTVQTKRCVHPIVSQIFSFRKEESEGTCKGFLQRPMLVEQNNACTTCKSWDTGDDRTTPNQHC